MHTVHGDALVTGQFQALMGILRHRDDIYALNNREQRLDEQLHAQDGCRNLNSSNVSHYVSASATSRITYQRYVLRIVRINVLVLPGTYVSIHAQSCMQG
jgi:hypothetical protein